MNATDLINMLELMVQKYGDHPVRAFDTADGVLHDVVNVAFTTVPQGIEWFEIYSQLPVFVQPVVRETPVPQPVVFGETKFG